MAGDDCDSDDVVMVDISEDKTCEPFMDIDETRPLMQLFQRLISNDKKQNTILTNAQIISILHKEFDIDITTLHDLEVHIYLNIVKKFLKDWPQWDEFDSGINSLMKQKANQSIKTVLENKYKHLKDYLKVMIGAARPLAQEAVAEMIKERTEDMAHVDTSKNVLEIYCTRQQLNELILSQPDTNDNVFNFAEVPSSAISLKSIPLESIFNWTGVTVIIELPWFSYSRATTHKLSHVLVNSKNGPRNLKQTLNENIQMKGPKKASGMHKEQIFHMLNQLRKRNVGNKNIYNVLQCLIKIIRSDLNKFSNDIKIPVSYRQHSNKYPYYRKLCKKVETSDVSIGNPYDLYIEETLSPMHEFHIGKLKSDSILPADNTWLNIECTECKFKVTGVDLDTVLIEHFSTYHSNEPDWTCTNCEKTFSVLYLTKNKWYHKCNG